MCTEEWATIEHRDGTLWTAVRTRSRCEKVVFEHCRRRVITCYLPLLRRAKRYQRRTVETFLPMFPGYVFVQLADDGEDRDVLLASHKVVRVLLTDLRREAILIRELGDLQILQAANLAAELEVKPEIVPGLPVLITSGPLAGTHGIVEYRRTKTRVTINVEMLGQSVTAELDVEEVTVDD